MSVKKIIQNTWHSVTDFILGSFLAPLAAEIRKSGGKVLMEAAQAAVLAAEASGGSGEKKFQVAFHAVTDTLLKAGIAYTSVAIRGAIEAAVAKMKAGNVG